MVGRGKGGEGEAGSSVELSQSFIIRLAKWKEKVKCAGKEKKG